MPASDIQLILTNLVPDVAKTKVKVVSPPPTEAFTGNYLGMFTATSMDIGDDPKTEQIRIPFDYVRFIRVTRDPGNGHAKEIELNLR
jgi:hypothetical protein